MKTKIDSTGDGKPILEIILKCDSIGSVEAVTAALSKMALPEVDIKIIRSGVGAVAKSDLLLAEAASRLIIGFQVDVMPGLDRALREHRVEVRLYNVIYALAEDVGATAENMVSRISKEQVTGSAKVVALFKGERKGIIIGCEIADGYLALGQHFRIISAIGPIFSGVIESLHVGENAVQKATPGQQVGIKIKRFNKVRIGDIVESFRPSMKKARGWEPSGQIIRK